MPTTDNNSFQHAIRRTLEHHSGNGGDARSIAETTIGTWRKMSDRLAPVIGAKGVDILFRRSLQMTGITFRWLEIAEDHKDNADLAASILTRLSKRKAEAAAEAGYTLLLTFTELLATMIGKSLTKRLLLPVWDPPSPESNRRQNNELQSHHNPARHRSAGT